MLDRREGLTFPFSYVDLSVAADLCLRIVGVKSAAFAELDALEQVSRITHTTWLPKVSQNTSTAAVLARIVRSESTELWIHSYLLQRANQSRLVTHVGVGIVRFGLATSEVQMKQQQQSVTLVQCKSCQNN